MSQEMDTLQAAVTASDTVQDSVIALLNGLGPQIADAAGDRAKSLALADDVTARAASMAAAVAANTPPVVPPVNPTSARKP